MIRTCERCPVKDQCRHYYNQRFSFIKSYINNIDVNEFCQSIHLCSTSLIVVRTDQCSKCVESFQSRKIGVSQGIVRITSYFDDICQSFAGKQCQVFIKQIQQSLEKSIDNVHPREMCRSIGFCSTMNNLKEKNFDIYEKYWEDEIEENICSILGPFEMLCRQMVRGQRKLIETVKINYNIRDLMQIGEKGIRSKFFTAAFLGKLRNDRRVVLLCFLYSAECKRDQCQCCVNEVGEKKESMKSIGDRTISIFIRSCDYCPEKDQCKNYVQQFQTQFDSYIANIDSKQVCVRLGFCQISTLCRNMGIFQQSCEEALSSFTRLFQDDRSTLERHLSHTSVVVLPTKSENKDETTILYDSNSTCILCEYAMNILSNYVHRQSTEKEIEQSLERVCNEMPSTIKSQCHDLIDNYGPAIIATLVREFDPLTICRKLNLCTKQMKVNVSGLTRTSVAACGICDYVSTYVNFALKRDSSERSLQHALSTVCLHLSNEQHSLCQMFVELFGPHIRKLDLELGNNFCKQLTICQTWKDEKNMVKPSMGQPSIIHVPLKNVESNEDNDKLKHRIMKNLDDTVECVLCRYVVSYLDAILKTNKSEAAIEDALEKVCSIVPSECEYSNEVFSRDYLFFFLRERKNSM